MAEKCTWMMPCFPVTGQVGRRVRNARTWHRLTLHNALPFFADACLSLFALLTQVLNHGVRSRITEHSGTGHNDIGASVGTRMDGCLLYTSPSPRDD